MVWLSKGFKENSKVKTQTINITIRNALAVAAIERTTSVTILRKRALVLVALLTDEEVLVPTTLLHPNCGQSSKTRTRERYSDKQASFASAFTTKELATDYLAKE